VQTPTRIADYAETAGVRLKGAVAGSGYQPGDPARAAEAILRIAEIDNPPRHLVLGKFGLNAVTTKLGERLAEIEQWRETSLSADFLPD
jgi:hypothetical protein